MDNSMPILLVPGLVQLAADLRTGAAGPVAVRPGDGRQPHPRRQYGRDCAPDPGRGAAALRARRAFDGRLYRLRDHAPGAGAGGKTGADQHPGATRYARGDRPPPRHDGPRQGAATIAPCSTSCFPGFVHPSRRERCQPCASSSTTWATISGVEAFIRQQTAVISRPDSRPTLAWIKCPTLVLSRRRGQHHPEFAVGGDGRRHSRRESS